MLYQPKKMFAGNTKVLGGPYVARGPNVAQAWLIALTPIAKKINTIKLTQKTTSVLD